MKQQAWLAIGWGDGSAEMRVVRSDADMVEWLWHECGGADGETEEQTRARWAEYVADEDNWTHLFDDVRRFRCTIDVGETGHIEFIRLLDDVDDDFASGKILRGYRNGDVVFIECDRPYTAEQYKVVAEQLNVGLARRGVTAVLLHHGLRVVAREETPAP